MSYFYLAHALLQPTPTQRRTRRRAAGCLSPRSRPPTTAASSCRPPMPEQPVPVQQASRVSGGPRPRSRPRPLGTAQAASRARALPSSNCAALRPRSRPPIRRARAGAMGRARRRLRGAPAGTCAAGRSGAEGGGATGTTYGGAERREEDPRRRREKP